MQTCIDRWKFCFYRIFETTFKQISNFWFSKSRNRKWLRLKNWKNIQTKIEFLIFIEKCNEMENGYLCWSRKLNMWKMYKACEKIVWKSSWRVNCCRIEICMTHMLRYRFCVNIFVKYVLERTQDSKVGVEKYRFYQVIKNLL